MAVKLLKMVSYTKWDAVLGLHLGGMYRSKGYPVRFQRVKRFLWFRVVTHDMLYGRFDEIKLWLEVNKFVPWLDVLNMVYLHNEREIFPDIVYYFDLKSCTLTDRGFRNLFGGFKRTVPFYRELRTRYEGGIDPQGEGVV